MLPFHQRTLFLFDLDGTVIDSKDGIFGGIRYTMERLKMGEMPESIMRQFIGPSIGASFRRHYQFTLEQAEQALGIPLQPVPAADGYALLQALLQ